MNNKYKYIIIDTLKTNKSLQPIYNKLKGISSGSRFSFNSIYQYSLDKDESITTRVNLVLPTLRKTKVFGGISTALQFFTDLSEELGGESRIVVLNDEHNDEKWEYKIDGFSRNSSKKFIYYLADTKRLSIRKNDIFIFTSWRTQYTLRNVINWHKDIYNDFDYKCVYLIQDFEPGFYPWSTEYVLAESTYKVQNLSTIAVFNSRQLFDYFNNNNYKFSNELYFEPSLNPKLKAILLKNKDNNKHRKKQIIVYGRPSEGRNAFEILRESLDMWSRKFSNAKEWKIISLGATYKNILLSGGMKIECYGKVSLEEYAQYMFESYAGVSLMISPHPSYPPLEMSTFGVKTITNNFANKSLMGFNENLMCVDNCTPEEISDRLVDICNLYSRSESNISMNEKYLTEDGLINVACQVAGLLKHGSI